MEKISGIIPQSPRTASKRVIDDRPVRPGTPSFGRPEGSDEIRDRVSLSNIKGVMDPAKEIKTYKNPKEAQHVQIADRVTKDFFSRQELEPNEYEDELTSSMITPDSSVPTTL